MNLDRYTTEGKKFISEERRTGRLIEKHHGVRLVYSNYDAEKFDAFIHKGNELVGVAELKTRPYFNRKLKTPCTLDLLREKGYLITAEKLDILQKQSRIYNVYSYVFVLLPNDKKVLSFKICDKKGKFLFSFKRFKTKTKYSCNDHKGDTERINAFLPIKRNPNFTYFNIPNY
jgi:hypothetical protein|tara:strand:+ start:1471 stop:1989 length:519 start_codon:yes stop_codon:yes gene_type:complete